LDGPLTPAKSICCFSLVNHWMNLAAAFGYFASFGIPMPSGLLQLAAVPDAPGVGRYSTWFTTDEELGTLYSVPTLPE
jgi:hypothetical protein